MQRGKIKLTYQAEWHHPADEYNGELRCHYQYLNIHPTSPFSSQNHLLLANRWDRDETKQLSSPGRVFKGLKPWADVQDHSTRSTVPWITLPYALCLWVKQGNRRPGGVSDTTASSSHPTNNYVIESGARQRAQGWGPRRTPRTTKHCPAWAPSQQQPLSTAGCGPNTKTESQQNVWTLILLLKKFTHISCHWWQIHIHTKHQSQI